MQPTRFIPSLFVGVVASLALFIPTKSSGAETALKITTYNIRYANPNDGQDVWTNRQRSVIDYASHSDIIGMQEVTEVQFAQLRDGLPNHSSYGLGRDDGKSGGEHAPIFYRKDKFEVIDQGTFWLSETPDKVGQRGWDAALPRTCTWIHFREQSTNKELYVANTHFDHQGKSARSESGKLIARRLAELPMDLPIVMMGDLNCLIDSEPYNAIAATLTDVRTASAAKPTGPASTWNGFSAIIPDRIIDHVFVRGIEVQSVSVEDPKTAAGRFASDHLPVQVVVRW